MLFRAVWWLVMLALGGASMTDEMHAAILDAVREDAARWGL